MELIMKGAYDMLPEDWVQKLLMVERIKYCDRFMNLLRPKI